MRGRDGKSRPAVPVATVVRLLIVIVSCFVVLVSIRIPLQLYLKVPLLVGIGFLIRWLFSFPRKIEADFFFIEGVRSERDANYRDAVRNYRLAIERRPDMDDVSLRLLSAYDGARETEAAMDLIKKLDGKVFKENQVEELEHLVGKYRPVDFEKTSKGFLLTLKDDWLCNN